MITIEKKGLLGNESRTLHVRELKSFFWPELSSRRSSLYCGQTCEVKLGRSKILRKKKTSKHEEDGTGRKFSFASLKIYSTYGEQHKKQIVRT